MLTGEILTTLRCGDKLLDLSSPVVMGVINVTPDSFYPPSRIPENPGKTLDAACQMTLQGAKIIDIGGMSSRPGAEEISTTEEIDRVIPVIESLVKSLSGIVISIDTYRSEVAAEALKAGATMINDISGGALDERILNLAASNPVAYVLMHMRGKPSYMQTMTDYEDVIAELLKYFVNKMRQLHRLGMRDIVIDPGFGFSKTMQHNYRIIDQLRIFRMLGYPVMIGVSRKSTLSQTIGGSVEDTLAATTAFHMAALLNGASILRAHDVKPAMDAIAVYNKLTEAKSY